ncbi:hypothetical protein H7X46_01620 [Pseudonocardia sp. C8]|uniref:hypothetical protein n=1 Tax=Pseudonocardia sp. C8 TaxID=2762759 RepID=UPI001642353E|nr:hypothetical protein [Pseudonocardia sp. C8]MBC3189763.1 hypothetical protein [Pseudonocardia sp. C8]
MTGVDEQAAALRRLVERLDDTAAVLAGLRDAVAGAWDDAAGREWTGRLDLVRRAADRLAGEAATEASDLERRAAEAGAGEVAGAGSDGAAGGDRGPGSDRATAVGGTPGQTADGAGVRLPGLTGTRPPDRRGAVAPLLPPMPGGTADR